MKNKPILRNGTALCDHAENVGGEHISIQHIVSYDNTSKMVNISIRVDDIQLNHVGRDFEKLHRDDSNNRKLQE